MRAVVQRVSSASVHVAGAVIGAIDGGLLVLLGVGVNDTEQDARYVVEKIVGLRIFRDEEGRFNRSVSETGGAILLVSQFTLHGDCRRGRRPSFTHAATPDTAIPLYEEVIAQLRARGLTVATGEFGAMMDVHLVNDGPVTLLIDSEKLF